MTCAVVCATPRYIPTGNLGILDGSDLALIPTHVLWLCVDSCRVQKVHSVCLVMAA